MYPDARIGFGLVASSADDPRYSTCFICSGSMGKPKLGPVIAWVDDRTPSGDINMWAVFAHPDCVRGAAHPGFDLDANAATGLEE
jgi:hypothetical protein